MKYTLLESLSALFEASSADSSMARRIEADICRRFGITEDAKFGDTRYHNLAHFIRLYASAQILHPQYMGIGSSEEVTNWFGWNEGSQNGDDREHATEPQGADETPNEQAQDTEITPHDAPVTAQKLDNVENWPQNLKNYVALLSSRYIEGILRICFDECGMKSYLIHKDANLLSALAEYFAEKDGKNIQSAKSDILRNNPPVWNYQKMCYLAKVLLPELALRTLIAPMANTPNCGKTDIQQNIEYLGMDNVELIQDMTTPVDVKINSNLEIAGNSTPLNYSQLVKFVNKWNYDIEKISNSTSTNENTGEPTYYKPSSADEDSDASEYIVDPSDGLNATYSSDLTPENIEVNHETTTTVQYPTRKLNGWYVVDLDQDQDNAKNNQSRIRRGVIAFNEPAAPNGKFYFRGGDEYNPSETHSECTNGVSSWCWTWDTYYNDYRDINHGDRGFMLISEHALDPDVLESYAGDYRAEHRLGDKYDSSAFGIVIAGPGKNKYSIPGLIKYDDNRGICFEARRDVSISSKAPGTKRPVHYDDSLVPNGGKIPGILKFDDYDSDDAPKILIINYSIFCLALIGKWDNNIKLVDDNGKLQTDELVALMQKWFPVPLDGQELLQHSEHHIVEHSVKDISTMGEIINHILTKCNGVAGEAKPILREKVFRLNGVPWRLVDTDITYQHVNDIEVQLLFMVDADEEHQLNNKFHNHTNESRSYDESERELPALLFFRFPKENVTVPLYTTPEELGDLKALDFEKIIPRMVESIFGKKGETHADVPVEFETDESGISWVRPITSAGKKRRIGFNADGQVFLAGPETDGNPEVIATSRQGNPFPPGSRGTYVVTPDGKYNLWAVYTGSADDRQHMLIYYVRDNRIRMYEVVGDILDEENSTALLRYEVNGEPRYTIGSIMGERARLQSPNDPYTNYIICRCGDDSVIDGIGLSNTAAADFGNDDNTGCVGLAIMIGFNPSNIESADSVNVGVIHWYSCKTLEYVGQNYVTLDELNRNGEQLPIRHIV